MSQKYATTPPVTDKMPGGIPFIIGNEAAERFSFYGMKAILFVFMTRYLQTVAGESDVMTDEQANTWIHVFVWAAYTLPLAGAILSDAFLGKYRTIILLSLVYCAGHVALSLFETRAGLLIGLGLITLGAGGIKPCVSAHVGDQFGPANQHLVSRVFQWYYFAINVGAALSMLLTPWLLDNLGPGVAFGVPAFWMFLATWVFWLGRNKFVHVPPSGMESVRSAIKFLPAIASLFALYPFVAIFWSLFDQTATTWVSQAQRMDLQIGGWKMLPSQIQAVNPFLILILIPVFSYGVYPAVNRVFKLTPLRKISIGFFLAVAAFAVPAWVEMNLTGGNLVPFKTQPGQDHWQAAPQADSTNWSAINLIDGVADGSGWVARMQRDENGRAKPVEVAFRLRDRQPWQISSVQVNPNTQLRPFLETASNGDDVSPQGKRTWAGFFRRLKALFTPRQEVHISDGQVRQCWARDVEILVAGSRDGPWRTVARLPDLAAEDKFNTVEFAPTEAEYVLLRIRDNHGGDFVSLGELAVHATGTLPPQASRDAQAVWPNVIALGVRPNIAWQVFAYLLITSAEIMISITCLEFSYTQAPNALKSFIMSIYLLSVAMGNLLTAAVNFVIQKPDGSSRLEGPSYFWFFTVLIAVAAIGFIVVAKMYRGQTHIQGSGPSEGK